MKAYDGTRILPDRVSVHPLREEDLKEADGIFRLAFGAFLGLADPSAFMGDTDVVRTRWRTDPSAAFAVEVGGELAGSTFATNWGSVGFFGPVTVRPDLWDQGIGRRLLEPTMDLFDRWGTRHVGLFTFSESPKHLALYQKFGFWPRFLTPIMSRAVNDPYESAMWTGYRDLPKEERGSYLVACRELTDCVFPGLDLTRDIQAVEEQGLGETVFLMGDMQLEGFAVCHCGAGTEAGSGACYVKFGAARPGPGAARAFVRLLDACTELAVTRGLRIVVAGVNTARREAYRAVLACGFRVNFVGVAMERPDEPGYNRADVYVMDDWR